jgi:Periplasmic component of the Tol biopolymer transport system
MERRNTPIALFPPHLATRPTTVWHKRVCHLTLGPIHAYTQSMKHCNRIQRFFALCLGFVILIGSSACTPGHVGTKVIGFVRAGQLWTIDADGANAFAVVAQGPAVIGYAWSPDHHLLAFRTLDDSYAQSAQRKQLRQEPVSGQIADAPGTLNTIGVDGGTAITIAFSSEAINYSTPYWNSDGSHLLYRQTSVNFAGNPASATWWIAQNDQPGGIAAKVFPPTFSLPSSSYGNEHDLLLGNADHGVFTTNIAGQQQQTLQPPLAGHPLPASLERVLWRPGNHEPGILYAVPDAQQQAHKTSQLQTVYVQLRLSNIHGSSRTLTHCTCTQFSWSPDGNALLYSEGSGYTIVDIATGASQHYQAETGAVPYWSPDSRFLLLDGQHSLTLINVQSHRLTTPLSDGQQANTEISTTPMSTSTLLEPIGNSLWSADSRQFAFSSHQRLHWLTTGQLHTGPGLYTATIDAQGNFQSSPSLVQRGDNITQVGWTYQDPNTSFLY